MPLTSMLQPAAICFVTVVRDGVEVSCGRHAGVAATSDPGSCDWVGPEAATTTRGAGTTTSICWNRRLWVVKPVIIGTEVRVSYPIKASFLFDSIRPFAKASAIRPSLKLFRNLGNSYSMFCAVNCQKSVFEAFCVNLHNQTIDKWDAPFSSYVNLILETF